MPINTDRGWLRTRLGASATLLAAFLFATLSGCGQPQVAPEHRELVLRLATGSSARDRGIIDHAAVEVERLSAAGQLAEEEEEALRAILDAAADGDWDRARRLAYSLREGQRPTEADRRRVAERTLPGMSPPGSHRTGR